MYGDYGITTSVTEVGAAVDTSATEVSMEKNHISGEVVGMSLMPESSMHWS